MSDYLEPGRSYRSALLVGLAVLLGFALDLLLGGGVSHAVGWAVALVVLVGADLIVTAAARAHRTVAVDDDTVRVGEAAIARADVLEACAVEPAELDPRVPYLGLRPGVAPQRSAAAVLLQLRGGRSVAVASRFPERLVAALGPPVAAIETVRRAEDAELPLLPEIDERADALFRVAGLDVPAATVTVEDLRASAAVFVARRPPVGFAQVDEVDGEAHLALLAVLPAWMRQGLGGRLLEQACAWAREAGYPAVTLTTYADVAWNAPFYARHGFAEQADPSPGLVAIREHERALGLDEAGRRIVMRRALAG